MTPTAKCKFKTLTEHLLDMPNQILEYKLAITKFQLNGRTNGQKQQQYIRTFVRKVKVKVIKVKDINNNGYFEKKIVMFIFFPIITRGMTLFLFQEQYNEYALQPYFKTISLCTDILSCICHKNHQTSIGLQIR